MQKRINKRLMRTKHGHEALVGRQPAQNKCAWCGKWMLDDRQCLTPEQRAFIMKFASDNGRSWKKKLADQWLNAEGPQESMAIRNSFGPSWLADFKMSKANEINDARDLVNRVNKRTEQKSRRLDK
jgi:hypothetical protein